MRSRINLLAIVGAALVLALAACSSSPSATDWFFGDSLAARVKQMRFADEIRYSLGDDHYRLKPSQEGRSMVAAEVEVRNRQANVVYLTVDKESIWLRDDVFTDYLPFDPFVDGELTADSGPDEDTFKPFFWGDGSEAAPMVALPASCGPDCYLELTGWLFFEVPEDVTFHQLILDSADTIYLRF